MGVRTFPRVLVAMAIGLGMAPGAVAQDRLTFIQVLIDDSNTMVNATDGLDDAFGVDVSPDAAFVYVAGINDRAVNVFERDFSTGRLEKIQSIDDLLSDNLVSRLPFEAAVAPDGEDLYVFYQSVSASVPGLPDLLVHFSIDPVTGLITFEEFLTDEEDGVTGMVDVLEAVFSPDSEHLYALGEGADSLIAFERDVDTGELVPIQALFDGVSFVSGLAAPNGIAISPNGRHVYVTSGFDDTVALFTRGLGSGLLDFDGVFQAATGLVAPEGVAVAPDGSQVFVAGSASDDLVVFDRDSIVGTLVEVQRVLLPLAGAGEAQWVLVSPDGLAVYVGTRTTPNEVFHLRRNQITGDWGVVDSALDSIGVLANDGDTAFGPDGDHFYVTSDAFNALSVFATSQPNQPCMDAVTIDMQFTDFTALFPEFLDDVDADMLPQDATLALIQRASCEGVLSALDEAITNAYFSNLNFFDFDVKKGGPDLSGFRELIAVSMMISADMQDAIRTFTGDSIPDLSQPYMIVTCDAPDSCLPDKDTPPGLGIVPKAANEPLSGQGDPDGDGITNAEEFANIVDVGGDNVDFAIVALDDTLDGTTLPPRGGGGSDSLCFIATAAYGTPFAPQIEVLRGTRDGALLPGALGAAFVDTYYRLSPPVAAAVADSGPARALVRAGLTPVVWAVRHPVSALLLAIGFAALGTWRRRPTSLSASPGSPS